MMLIRIGVAILLFFVSGVTLPVFSARSLSITGNKSSLFGDEELTITASASGFTDGETIYIKGAFYKDDTSRPNYFGYTKKDDSWIKNSGSKDSQRSVKIGQWDNILNIKSDFNDSGFKGEGEYKFKVGFYTVKSSGEIDEGVQWTVNILSITLNKPDPTPTNSPTSTCTPTNSPEATSTQTPTSTLKPTNTPTLKPTEKKSPTPMKNQGSVSTTSGEDEEGEILSAEEENVATSSVTFKRTSSKKVFIITFLFIGIGCALLSLAFVLKKQFFSKGES